MASYKCSNSNFVHKMNRVLRYSTSKNVVTLKSGQKSLKVIETDTHRSATAKVANFSYPVYLTPLLRGYPLEFCNGTGARKKLE